MIKKALMSTNNLQNILLAIGEFIQPIANTLNKLQKDPETIRLLQNRPLAKVSLMSILDVDIYLKINAYH